MDAKNDEVDAVLVACPRRDGTKLVVLAELLQSRVHPRLLPEQVKVHARDIRAAAKELRTTVDAVAGPNERVEQLQRVRRALATVAHADLTSLKRL